MDIKSLISKTIEETEAILLKANIAYEIEEIKGYKDQEILCERRVIRAREVEGKLILTVTNFKTHI